MTIHPKITIPLTFLIIWLVGCAPPRETPTPKPTPTAIPQTPTPLIATSLAGTNWELVALNGVVTAEDFVVSAFFDPATQLVGWTGCSNYSANYQTDAGSITVSDVQLTTSNTCDGESALGEEKSYFAMLTAAVAYEIDGADLILRDAPGTVIARYRAMEVFKLNGSSWVLDSYRDEGGQLTPVSPFSPPVTAVFAGGALNGYGGCSNYEGTYRLVGSNVTIQDVQRVAFIGSDAACKEGGELNKQESAYLTALILAHSLSIQGPQLTLHDDQTEPVIVLQLVMAPGITP